MLSSANISESNKKKIVYLVPEDWYFYSHRIALARAARESGYEVIILTRIGKHGQLIRDEGFKLIEIDFKREVRNPLKNIGVIRKIRKVYQQEKPDIVHHVSIKAVILGSIAASFTKVPVVINALAGLGFIFTSSRLLPRIFKILVVEPALKILFDRRNTWTIFQNIDDKRLLMTFGILNNARTRLIRGSGVDLNEFRESPEPAGEIIVMFASRMLRDKGVNEFVSAARKLVQSGIKAKFVLVGDVDKGNPTSIEEQDLIGWNNEGILDWWGYRADMSNVIQKAHLVCLPSYREGLPKVLLEAAASARPIIASNVPGCREIVHDGVNGILVPVKDPDMLANAIEKLVNEGELRRKMGRNGRRMVEDEFELSLIIEQTMKLYDDAIEEAENTGNRR